MSTQAYRVTFTKKFVSGPLEGIEYPERLDFPSNRSACRWIALLLKNPSSKGWSSASDGSIEWELDGKPELNRI